MKNSHEKKFIQPEKAEKNTHALRRSKKMYTRQTKK